MILNILILVIAIKKFTKNLLPYYIFIARAVKTMTKSWRKLDNTAKIFSLNDKKNINIFRYSIILKHHVDKNILKRALEKSLEHYPSFKVKFKTGLFWNYFAFNPKNVLLDVESNMPCEYINPKKNNDYLFKVTHYKNKINLDVFHALTDGLGATIFLKEILYNYLDLKYKINADKKEIDVLEDFEDANLKHANKKLILKSREKKAFSISEKINLQKNKTYHYILNLKNFKSLCKKNNVSISEYLTALYIYAIYKTVYNKSSNKDIKVTVPIDLRRHYHVETLSNFFTCASIDGNVLNSDHLSFEQILEQVHKEFQNKLTTDKIDAYLSRDVKLGTNIGIRLIPLFIKKLGIKYLAKRISASSTTTLSNVGSIEVLEKYQKYVENIMALVNVGCHQKVKCTVCSYQNHLTVTINSNLVSNSLEKEFYRLLKQYAGKVKLESNYI